MSSKGQQEDAIQLNPTLANDFDANLEEGKVQIENNGVIFEAMMDARGYNPEDVKVTITKTHIKIEGHHEGEWESSEFYQEVIIPEGVSPANIIATINARGILRFIAPVGTGQPPATAPSSVSQQEETVETSVSQADSSTIDSKFVDSSNEVKKSQDAFEVAVNVQGYQKEDIKVTVYRQVVTVQIQRKVTTTTETKEIYKKYTLPEGTAPETVKSTFDVQKKVLKITGKVTTKSVEQKNETQQLQQQAQKVVDKQQQQNQQVTTTKKVVTIRTIIVESEEYEKITENINQVIRKNVVMRDDGYDTQIQLIIKKLKRNVRGDKLEAIVNVPGYNPEEIEIRITKRVIIIRARQETETLIREFYETVTLPKGVKPESITCTLAPDDGVLTVSAPIVQEPGAPAQPASPAAVQPVSAPQPQAPVPASQPQSQVAHQQQQQVTKETSRDVTQTSQQSQHVSSTTTITRQEQRIVQSGTMTIQAHVDTSSELVPSKEPEPLEDVTKDVAIVNDGKKFEVEIDVSNFEAEQIQVKIYKSTVVIKAYREIKEETRTSVSKFYKKFTIPAGVNPENIQCTRTEKGTLKISSTIETTTKTSVQQQQKVTSTTSSTTAGQGTPMAVKPKILTGEAATQFLSTTITKTESSTTYEVEDPTKFERSLELGGYKPEEIEITIANGWVVIQGKQEMGEDQSYRCRQFTKKYSIPSGVKPEQIACIFHPNGTLALSNAPQ